MLFLLSRALFPMAMLPAGFFSGASQVTAKMSPRVSRAFEIMTLLWLIGLMSAYAAFSFETVDFLLKDQTMLPALGWGVAATVAPWAVFALRDRDNMLMACLVLMTAAGCLAAAALNLNGLAMTFGARFLAVSAVATALLGIQFAQEERAAKKKP
jgi:hypothetical protein